MGSGSPPSLNIVFWVTTRRNTTFRAPNEVFQDRVSQAALRNLPGPNGPGEFAGAAEIEATGGSWQLEYLQTLTNGFRPTTNEDSVGFRVRSGKRGARHLGSDEPGHARLRRQAESVFLITCASSRGLLACRLR